MRRSPAATVHVVDDDASLRDALARRLRVQGYDVRAYASADDFVARYVADEQGPACLLLDVRMPGRSGLDLQRELLSKGSDLPVVFLTGYGELPMCIEALKAGASDFLLKPAPDSALLLAVAEALRKAAERQAVGISRREWEQRLGQLTLRERQVFQRVVVGMPNKAIAAELGLAEITVKVYRRGVMHKLQAGSLAALVRMASRHDLTARNEP